MEDIIPIDWYCKAPFDVEMKQYMLLAYLQRVDEAFIEKKFSPWLIHTERMRDELWSFRRTMIAFSQLLKSQTITVTEGRLMIREIVPEHHIGDVIELVDFSTPLIAQRVDTGYSLHQKSGGILW